MFAIKKKRREGNEVNTSSTADIAFLLLIFFLVTTQIQSDKGIFMMLPPKQDVEITLNQRNILDILINSNDLLLIEDELKTSDEVKNMVIQHVNNHGRNGKLSDSPKKAIVSIKTDRGTSYDAYVVVLDQVKSAYNELRAGYLNMSVEEYAKLKKNNPEDAEKLAAAKKAFPMQISDANPTDVGAL